ncbi:hypothetical protein BDV93DRAFT_524423 [Ceratobasidium sp. AG-I]|nr:hypothetical protein BDV93DRAFT_524423 [Ceratobasidium sp. AG-I]
MLGLTRGLVVVTFLIILFPPAIVAIAVSTGDASYRDLFISIALTLLGWIPGVIHAVYFTAERVKRGFMD